LKDKAKGLITAAILDEWKAGRAEATAVKEKKGEEFVLYCTGYPDG
jgi:hypothetical protein